MPSMVDTSQDGSLGGWDGSMAQRVESNREAGLQASLIHPLYHLDIFNTTQTWCLGQKPLHSGLSGRDATELLLECVA